MVMKSVYQFTNIGIIVNGFSAYHISSRGLKYALAFSSFEDEEVKEEEYKKALLNVLTAQDFDSIPLVESYEGPITAIGRRRLHDGDHDDVFILSTEEVSKLPQTASVIRCIFEVLSNEHHIVFLTDEEDQIQDVVTIGMLSSPIIQEYLTLLVSKLSSENWDFNEKYLKSSFTPTYDFPKIIHQELKKLGTLVDDADGAIPTDFDVSKQIVHILSLLQPLKHWEGGQESDSLLSTDFPLTIATPDYIPGTAGYFAQHPFGAVMENTEEEVVQDLAFRLFSEANNWDHLALKTLSGIYTHLIGKNQFKLIETRVSEDVELEELVHLMNEEHRPLLVDYEDSVYPGIITAQDIVFAKDTKTKLVKQFLKLEIQVRNTYLHVLATRKRPNKSRYFFGGGEPVWEAKIADVYRRLVNQLPENQKVFSNSDFANIFLLRNAMAQNDFAVTPEDEIDPQKTSKYISFLKDKNRSIHDFIAFCDGINTLQYTEFAQIFHSEFKSMNNREKEPLSRNSFKDHIVHLTSREGVFLLHFKNGDVVSRAKEVKLILAKRNFPWKCEILDVRSEGQKIADLKKAEAAKK
ncbi:hypothetical protein OAV29_00085 [Candidatus Poseidoniaceae archaeon]|nr:hypothetical protein [Candidatus Poseidoniaceae archaeon]